ncbi:MAG TPA: serine hydrolase domain-containing protein [Bacteroidota bacterium]|nr:serine hydrolase domain-containing protein [Bacteroidota bacterium]
MRIRGSIFLIALGLTFHCAAQNSAQEQRVIHDLDSIRVAFHIPAIAFGVANCDSVLLMGATGVREINTTDSVTIQDEFHIGSLAKGLLSFIAGKLVDEGMISWNTKFFDLFPEMKESSRSEYYRIDLKDLLSHRASLHPFNDSHSRELIRRYNELHPNDRFSNYRFSQFVLTLKPQKYDSGQFYNYSNLDYLLASLMLEKASGMSYAQLIARTNKDLDLDFQIGWPKSEGKFQPSGHLVPKEQGWGESTSLQVWNGDGFTDWVEDYLFYCTPAGHIRVTLPDFLKYLQLDLKGVNGEDNYLKASTYNFIFNGAKEYSMGWGNDIVDGNHYYSHNGSVGTFFANAIIIKERKIAIALMANAGNNETKGGLLRVIRYLEKTFPE